MSHGFDYSVPKWVTDIDPILRALNNHILRVHPVVSKTEGGGTTAAFPMLLSQVLYPRDICYLFLIKVNILTNKNA